MLFKVFALCFTLVSFVVAQPPPCSGSATPCTPFWFHGVTPDEIAFIINFMGGRITQIRAENPDASPPTFSVSMVKNDGACYTPYWVWYYGVDASFIPHALGNGTFRLISLDPYYESGRLVFALVAVYNQDCYSKGWWYWTRINSRSLNRWITTSPPKRLIELRPYKIGNSRYFAAIAVENVGADQMGWWYWYGVSIDFLAKQLQIGNTKRVTNLAPDPVVAGGWDAIMVESDGPGWVWWFGQSADDCFNNVLNQGMRMVDFSIYNQPNPLYTCVGLENRIMPQDCEV